jgi:hypothetical protein
MTCKAGQWRVDCQNSPEVIQATTATEKDLCLRFKQHAAFGNRCSPPLPIGPQIPVEAKGVVYTKRWVIELLLDLAGYRPEDNLVDTVAVEPAAGVGAFLGPMIERLAESCRRSGRSLADCRESLVAWELDDASAERARALATDVLVGAGALAQSLAPG